MPQFLCSKNDASWCKTWKSQPSNSDGKKNNRKRSYPKLPPPFLEALAVTDGKWKWVSFERFTPSANMTTASSVQIGHSTAGRVPSSSRSKASHTMQKHSFWRMMRWLWSLRPRFNGLQLHMLNRMTRWGCTCREEGWTGWTPSSRMMATLSHSTAVNEKE